MRRRRAIGSQMANAVHEQIALILRPADLDAANDDGAPPAAEARASGSRLLRPGYKELVQQQSVVPKRSAEEEEEEEGEGAAGEAAEGSAGEADREGSTTAGQSEAETDTALNELLATFGEGDVLRTHELLPRQHFTEPPPRFSEGSLVRCASFVPASIRRIRPHAHTRTPLVWCAQ